MELKGKTMRKNLSFKDLLIMGGGLFSMHFGAACLLYPVTWGADAGSAVLEAYAGVFMSGIVLPCLGYVALAKGHGSLLDLICRAAPVFGRLFVMLMILILGPLLMLPRITAALWAAVLQLSGWSFAGGAAGLVFNAAVYAVVFIFVSSQGKVIDRVGRFLFPMLLTIVTAVIVQSVVTPLAPRVPPVFDENPVLHGFLAAYAAGDLQCALIYGLVVVHGIRDAGIEKEHVSRSLLKVGMIGLGLLGLGHFGHMIAGANTGGTIRLNLSALYVQMVVDLWGPRGGLIFLAALATASLTASIGITSSTAAMWEDILGGRVSYRAVCVLTCVVSCLVSSAGLDAIISVVGPLLDACYPATIVVTMYYCLCRNSLARRNLFALKCALFAAGAMGGAALLHAYAVLFGLNLPVFEKCYAALPLSGYSMAWLPVSAAVFAAVRLCGSGIKGEAAAGEIE